MRITSKISHYHKGVLAFLLAPFLWLQMYFNALEELIINAVYDDLFNHQEETKYSQTTHLLSFLCFSGFCFLAYYKNVDHYISVALYSLWLINYCSVKFKTGLYVDKPAWARLETKPEHWEWSLMADNQQLEHHYFDYSQIKCVLIAAVTYGDNSFRNQVLQIWHIYIQTQDEQQWVVYQDATIQNALLKATRLAHQLNTAVKVAESYGTNTLADFELEAVQNPAFINWNKVYCGNSVKIYKNFSTTTLSRWLQTVFHQIKDFIFIAVLSGFMQRYGVLLMLLFWDDFGLAAPPRLNLDSSLAGVFSLFSPDFNWILVLVFAITLSTLLYSIYQQSLRHEILINSQRIEYSIAGEQKGFLSFNQQLDMIVLKGFDKTTLIIINEHNRVLEINGLEEDEYDELYQMLLTV
jgi:hypothetical protein